MTTFTEKEVQEVLNYQIEFGKHKGTSIKKLIETLPQYAMWVVGQGESNNKAFTKAQTFIKLVLEWGEDGPGGVGSSTMPKVKPKYKKKKAGVEVVFPDKVEPEPITSWLYSWISLLPNDPDVFTFYNSEDSLQYCMMMEKYKTYGSDFFVIIKSIQGKGETLITSMTRELVDFEKGRFMNVAA